jgi:hypothetical protein
MWIRQLAESEVIWPGGKIKLNTGRLYPVIRSGELDTDLDSVRDKPRFKEIIEQFKTWVEFFYFFHQAPLASRT